MRLLELVEYKTLLPSAVIWALLVELSKLP